MLSGGVLGGDAEFSGEVAAVDDDSGLETGTHVQEEVTGPLVVSLAADYAALPLRPGALQIAGIAVGLAALAALAAALVARRLAAEPIVTGLREEVA